MSGTTTIVVPARLHSTRLPEKLALRATGRSLLEHTLDNLQPLRDSSPLWVVTDSEKLADLARPLADRVHLSTREFDSGTERIGEIVPQVKTSWLLNVQADEPEVDIRELRALMARAAATPGLEMATLAAPFEGREMWLNPNAVKVLTDINGMALYFSRQALPHGGGHDTPGVLHHLGVYAYQTTLLARWPTLPRGRLEACERLEQLRALENGIPIYVHPVARSPKGIDTEQDYQSFVSRTLQTQSHGR